MSTVGIVKIYMVKSLIEAKIQCVDGKRALLTCGIVKIYIGEPWKAFN